jgi:hypothetical protein
MINWRQRLELDSADTDQAHCTQGQQQTETSSDLNCSGQTKAHAQREQMQRSRVDDREVECGTRVHGSQLELEVCGHAPGIQLVSGMIIAAASKMGVALDGATAAAKACVNARETQ